ncbi:hypothetical protein [Paenibacillus luteus]|uniref:hypothetical protein n=1 Tax=Paenibacillus luteus TaxID=2545753 RepID=UPI001142B96E|nr:hypothetical protein [Paenibacillus luteus]
MEMLRDGNIIPGKSIGQFEIGCKRETLVSLIGQGYKTEIRSNCIVIKMETLWFWIDEEEIVFQIRAFNGFYGKFDGKIGIGETLEDVESHYGKSINEDYVYLITCIPGICFELKDVNDLDDVWYEMSAPIESIYVIATN